MSTDAWIAAAWALASLASVPTVIYLERRHVVRRNRNYSEKGYVR